MVRRTLSRLTAAEVRKLSKLAGMHADGGGLYLRVTPAGVPSWVFRYSTGERERYHGLGPLHTVSLAEARQKALECRKLRLDGLDPLEERRRDRLEKKLATLQAMTFQACAEAYIAAHQDGWRNAKHAAQWPATLAAYVFPVFGDLPVAAVDTALVMRVLQPIWSEKTETASRVRGRIEAVLGWATTSGYRSGDNPARWRGHLENLLPKKSRVAPVQHHEALDYRELGAFMAGLRDEEGFAERALEFAILTCSRTGEVLGARWQEFDLAGKVWTVPPERMKGGREHRVPLSARALAIIEEMAVVRSSQFVFPGLRAARPLSEMVLRMVLRRMGRRGLTVHGFRSSFADWHAERTSFPAEVREMALAHVVGDKVEAAYRRGDLFEKRRQLAEAWGRYCTTPAPQGEAKLIPLRVAAS
jgi:integrase